MAHSNGKNDNFELEPLNKNDANDGGESNFGGSTCGGVGTTPKRKRAAATKKIQFTTPEFSVTPIPTVAVNNRLLPSRRRYCIAYFQIVYVYSKVYLFKYILEFCF